MTINSYRTKVAFDFDRVQAGFQTCLLKAADEFGVISLKTSKDPKKLEPSEQIGFPIEQEHETDWIRALFGVIGDQYFHWLDLETRDIHDCNFKHVQFDKITCISWLRSTIEFKNMKPSQIDNTTIGSLCRFIKAKKLKIHTHIIGDTWLMEKLKGLSSI